MKPISVYAFYDYTSESSPVNRGDKSNENVNTIK